MNKYFVRYVRLNGDGCFETGDSCECATIVNIPDEYMIDLDLETFETAIQKTWKFPAFIQDILTINKL